MIVAPIVIAKNPFFRRNNLRKLLIALQALLQNTF